MRIEIWGARGSIPSSHAGTVKYGGNTTSIEIRTRKNDLIIIDAGSGIRRLGAQIMRGREELQELEGMVDFVVEELLSHMALEKSDTLRALDGTLEYRDEINLLLTHNHWDHIQGFPFFIPAYVPNKKINIYGQLKADHRIYDVLSGQMSCTFFPVMLENMQSIRNYTEIVEDTFRIGDAVITSRSLNHPQGCLGYRISCGEMNVAFCTDTEHPEEGIDENVLELASDADIFFYDCQYTPEEYSSKKGWGHSTWKEGIRVAREAGVKKLVMFHHDPEHNDAFIDKMEARARNEFPNLMAAREGLVLADFPEGPTWEPDTGGPGADAMAESPEFASAGDVVRVVCGRTLQTLRVGDIRERLDIFVYQGARLVIFDCSEVVFTEARGLVALADVIRGLDARRIETEICGASPELLRKLRIARFDQVTTLPEKPFKKKV